MGFDVYKGAFSKYPSLQGASVDAGYRSTFELNMESVGMKTTVSKKDKTQWIVLPKRWIVERAFAWFNGFRRLAKDFEKRTCAAEAMVTIASINRLIRNF